MWASMRWRKSSFSQEAGSSCVDVAFGEGGAAVRDSKNTAGPVLAVPAATWRRFVSEVTGS